MNYIELTTDRLIQLLIKEVGVPIPTYDYKRKAFVVRIPHNKTTPEGFVTGVELVYTFETFRDACIHILEWNDNEIKRK